MKIRRPMIVASVAALSVAAFSQAVSAQPRSRQEAF